MESARNVSELKSSFVRAQVRILSEALQPQEDWRLYAPEAEEGDLSDKVVDDALQKCKDSLLRLTSSVVLVQYLACPCVQGIAG